METIMLGGKLVSYAGLVGSDLIFTTVRSTSNGIISGENYIFESDKSGMDAIKNELKMMDIKTRVETINLFVMEINNSNQSESIHYAVIAVENILHNINGELKEITDKIKDHTEKYFNSWRTLDCSSNLEKLKLNYKLLESRFDMLLKLLSIDKSKLTPIVKSIDR